MDFVRITRAMDVLENWSFINEGLEKLKHVNKLSYNEAESKKLFCRLAADRSGGFVGLTFDDSGFPLAFGVMCEDTVPLSRQRSFTACAVYYKTENPEAVTPLIRAFETWCRKNNIFRYSYLSRRPTTAARRCFMGEKYGFNKTAIMFEKQLN